jgi:pyruvate formate lyase activating enzyme
MPPLAEPGAGRDGQMMILAGLQATSLIDYPGKVSSVAFISGCNFRCPYCHNPELARGHYPQRISEKELLAFLLPRRQLIDAVVVSGGEPTLHPGLAQLCRSIRNLGLAIKLDTNGSRPELLESLIRDHLVDYIAMDIKTALDRYGPPIADTEACRGVARSIRILMDSGLDYEFRTTCVRSFVDGPAVASISATIQGARHYVLQTFRPVTLLNPDHFKDANPGFEPAEMERLRQIALPFVDRCSVR